jgi:hypothetical protein
LDASEEEASEGEEEQDSDEDVDEDVEEIFATLNRQPSKKSKKK